MTTVREIAEFAGVSKSTVSLVLNNKPGVSDEMRQTVLDAVNELEALELDDLLPEKIGFDTVADHKSQALSIMVLHPPVLRSSYVFSEVLQGIQSAAERYKLQLRLVVNDPLASAQHVSNLYLTDEYLRPDGVLVFGARQHEPLLEKVIARDIPCVVLGREAKKYNVSGIERDEVHYGYHLTQHLLDLGHRSIAFVGGETEYDYTNNRLKGYQQALRDAGIADDEHIVCLGNGTQATASVLQTYPDLTAIVYVNDSYALEGLTAIRQHNKRIPDDLSIASFDNSEFARNCPTPITSIAYDHFKEGQWAIKMLLDQIRHSFLAKSQLVFKGELIVRQSTSAPPK
ncbi:MAG: LacI family DNA-binding transcriptional regulator [Phototrophicaceae bacterium]